MLNGLFPVRRRDSGIKECESPGAGKRLSGPFSSLPDVSYEAIPTKSFSRNEKFYGYFGPTPALARMPLNLLQLITRLVDEGPWFIELPVNTTHVEKSGSNMAIHLKNFLSVGHRLLEIPIRRVRTCVFRK